MTYPLNFRNKKGNAIIDIVFAFIFIIVFAIGLFVFANANNVLESVFVNDPNVNETYKEQYVEQANLQQSSWDNAIIIIFIGLVIAMLVSAFFVDTHPIFFVAFVIGFIIALTALVNLTNVAYEVSMDEGLSDGRDEYPKATWIVDNLFILIIITGLSVAAIMFGKQFTVRGFI